MAKFNTSLVVGLTFVATLGGLLFGWDTAVISGAVSSIDAYFIDPLGLSETARSSLSGWTISSALIGCIIGAAVAGWISTALGRKGGLIVAALLFLAGSLGSAVPEIRPRHDRSDGSARPVAFHFLPDPGRSGCGHRLDAVALVYR